MATSYPSGIWGLAAQEHRLRTTTNVMPLTQEQATGTLNPLSFLLVLQRPFNLNVKVADWLFHQKVDSLKKKKKKVYLIIAVSWRKKTRTLNPVRDVWCKAALGEVPVGRKLPHLRRQW